MPHSYDFSKNYHMRPQLLQLIRGIRGPRTNELTLKQICAYYVGTPQKFIKDNLNELLIEDYITIRRTALSRHANTRCIYLLTDKGESLFQHYVRERACHTG